MFGEKLLALWVWLHSNKRSFLKDQTGASAIEYALIVGLIVVAIAGAVGLLGDEIVNIFDSVRESLSPDTTE